MVASHRGDSHSSVATRRRVAKLFDEWRETLSPSDARNLAPAAFESIVNADVFAKPETYQRFSTWLVDEYTMNDGDTLSPGSVVDYFGALLNMAFDRAMELSNGRLSVGASDFFKCLETGQRFSSHQVNWLRGIKNKLRRRAVANCKESGKTLDHSAEALYAHHISEVIRAYARIGTPDAAKKKLTVNSSWGIAGRSAEGQWLSYEAMSWDSFFKAAHAESLQQHPRDGRRARASGG